MPIRPVGSRIYIVRSTTTEILASGVVASPEVEFFDRLEFSNEKLRQAKNTNGSVPQYFQLFGGQVAQVQTSCNSGVQSRPLGPDDANIDNIKRRFDISRYKLSGFESYDSSVDNIHRIAIDHKILLNRFQAHLSIVQSLDLSYTQLITMQGISFSYLTTTDVAMYGDAITPVGVLSVAALIGATSITSPQAVQFTGSTFAILGPGTANQEVVSISYAGGNTLNCSALNFNHPINEKILVYKTNLLITAFNDDVLKEIPIPTGGTRVRKGWELTIENRVEKAARATS